MFKFKKFNVHHGQGSMKVGVDAVLLGAWAGEDAKNILEVGTGCGVISLILAQRFKEAQILAIDIDEPSIEESQKNFTDSPWKDRLTARLMKFPDDLINFETKFDLIVSNPPYFNSGITNPATQRQRARHQDSLSVFSLIENCKRNLERKGSLSIITPIEFMEPALNHGKNFGLFLKRICKIRDNASRPEKRVAIEFSTIKDDCLQSEDLTLFKRCENNGEPSERYRQLCGEFYLKF